MEREGIGADEAFERLRASGPPGRGAPLMGVVEELLG